MLEVLRDPRRRLSRRFARHRPCTARPRALRRRGVRRQRGRRRGRRPGPAHGPHRRPARAGPPPRRPHVGRPRQHRHRQQGGHRRAVPPLLRARGLPLRAAGGVGPRDAGRVRIALGHRKPGPRPAGPWPRARASRRCGSSSPASPNASSARWPRRPRSRSASARGSTSRAASRRQANAILSIRMESGRAYAGRVFIDATYEGDLMAQAGVSYHVGREANARLRRDAERRADAATRRATSSKARSTRTSCPGDPTSGLLPGHHAGGPGEEGAGDRRVQAYNFRLCLTDVPDNRMPFPKPDGYDPQRYELLLRYVEAGARRARPRQARPDAQPQDRLQQPRRLLAPTTSARTTTTPRPTTPRASAIFRRARDLPAGPVWTSSPNDPRVPAAGPRRSAASGAWPRTSSRTTATGRTSSTSARRGAWSASYVMTEHHCRGQAAAPRPGRAWAPTAWTRTTAALRRRRRAPCATRATSRCGVPGPYPIATARSCRSAAECHEPARAGLPLGQPHRLRLDPHGARVHDPGQSAATAASLAIDGDGVVQDVPYPRLRERLLADGQVLDWAAVDSPR